MCKHDWRVDDMKVFFSRCMCANECARKYACEGVLFTLLLLIQKSMKVHAWVCALQRETLVARSDSHFKLPRARATGHGDESFCVMTWAFGLERM